MRGLGIRSYHRARGLRKLIVRTKYRATHTSYDELYREEQRSKYDKIVEIIKLDGIVLDLGCGTGLLQEYLAERGYLGKVKTLIGLDLTREMIMLAKTKIRKINVDHLIDYIEADAENIPLRQNSTDITISVTVLNLLEDPCKALEEIDRVTRHKAVITILKTTTLKITLANLKIGVFVGETDKDYIFVRGIKK